MTRLLSSVLAAACAAACVAAEGNRRSSLDLDGRPLGSQLPERRLVLSPMEQGALSEAHASWAEARSTYTDLSRRDPDDVNALIARARTFHAEGLARQAADLLEQEVRRRLSPPAELLLATGDAVLATDRPGQAVDYYEAARAQDPRDKRARFSLFTAYVLADRPEDATQLVKSVPPSELPRHLVLLAGRAALLADDAAYAASAFSTYLTDRPESVDVWVDLARARFRLEQYPAARLAVLRALALQPEHGAALVLQGHLSYLDGDLTAALTAYEHAQIAGVPPEELSPLVTRIRAQLGERAERAAGQTSVPAPEGATVPVPAAGPAPEGAPVAPAAPRASAADARRPSGPASSALPPAPPPAWSHEAWVGTARPPAIE